jgi:hypothetical protein
MRIPSDATIDEAKFTGYLLVQRPWDDKSGYLRRAGFELKNWPDLRAAIRRLADAVDAVEERSNVYGTFYRVEGRLEGPTGNLPVVCIWDEAGHRRQLPLRDAEAIEGKERQCLFNCMIVSRFGRPSLNTRFKPATWPRWSTLSTTLHPVPEDACWSSSTRLVSRLVS